MKQQILREEICEKLKKDDVAVAKIAVLTGRAFNTIRNWVHANDDQLTLISVLYFLMDHYSITNIEELLMEVELQQQ